MKACITGSAPPWTLLNEATSPASVANLTDKSAEASPVNSIPCMIAPDWVNSPSNSCAAKPALFANSSTKPDSFGTLSPNVVSKADRASLASDPKLTKSLPRVTAATEATPKPATVALPNVPAIELNLPIAFCDLVKLSVKFLVLPIIAIETFFSFAII